MAHLPFLCLESLLGEEMKRARPHSIENLASFLHQSTYIEQPALIKHAATSVISERLEWIPRMLDLSSKRRLVNGALDDVGEDEGHRTKRRRLALTLVADAHVAATPAVLGGSDLRRLSLI
jgi:hypothetical protein